MNKTKNIDISLNSQNGDSKLNGHKPNPDFKIISPADILEHTNELLGQANEDSALRDLIKSCKIDLTEVLLPPPIAMQIKSGGEPITLFTKGNFSIITGAAKSRKTFLISMLMAAAIKGSFQNYFFCNTKGVNIIFDTEQSRYKVQQNAKRICQLAETINPDDFCIYSLRTLDPSQRIDLIDKVLAETPKINFVAIDGIIDLEVDPILQAEQAQRIVSRLMKWTEIYNIHIACVLHYNKTMPTLLGHLGSFSHRKADSIIAVTKDKENKNISFVEPVDCREKEFSSFAFSVDEIGIPCVLEDYTFVKKTKQKKEPNNPKIKIITPFSFEAAQHNDILNLVFKIQKELGYGNLVINIKNAVEQITNQTIGINKAKEFIAFYVNDESIIKTGVLNKKPFYTLEGQGDLNMK
jgi:hypothetical protein